MNMNSMERERESKTGATAARRAAKGTTEGLGTSVNSSGKSPFVFVLNARLGDLTF